MSRLGIDIGGTFTDLYYTSNGQVIIAKSPTTPQDYTLGLFNALNQAGINLTAVEHIIHGSTIATNAVIERKLPLVPFITTAGFRDLIEIGRYHRARLYDPYQQKPTPLVRRRHRFEVVERIDSKGRVLIPLDEDQTLRVLANIAEISPTVVAVGLLNSYANPENEQRLKQLIEQELGGVFISLSSEVLKKIRPLGRFTVTILNAALKPIISNYIQKLEDRLRQQGFKGQLWISQSNGGIVSSRLVRHNPEMMLLSGPSMGIVASGSIGQQLGIEKVLTMDMGGTSTDVSVMNNGQGQISTERQVGWDMPLPVPMLNIETIGAGGGSIAWVDQGGLLKVGPQSAGARPGPVSYGRGGEEPTVTDANLLLGRLNPQARLGKRVELHKKLARQSLEDLGARIGLDWLECARGIIRIVQENMTNALKRVLIAKSRDPRDYCLVAFGGAGPIHASAVARLLSIPTLVCPFYSGVLCAFGATVADVAHSIETTYYTTVEETDLARLNRTFQKLEQRARMLLAKEGFQNSQIDMRRVAEMRYVGQTYEVETPMPDDDLDFVSLAGVRDEFDQMHQDRFGLSFPQDQAAFVNLRCEAFGRVTKSRHYSSIAGDDNLQPRKEREIYFDDFKEPFLTSVLGPEAVQPEARMEGPLCLELDDSTILLPPGAVCRVDDFRNVIIKL